MSTRFEMIEKARLSWLDELPYSQTFDDIYFSNDNPQAEVEHVFINGNDLPARWQNLANDGHFVIAETGFGSGLNFLLTWSLWKKYAPPSAHLHFISCEKYPLDITDLKQCHTLWPNLHAESSLLQASYPPPTPGFHFIELSQNVSLTLIFTDVETAYQKLLVCAEPQLEQRLRGYQVNAWFLDGFSPVKNPGMWSDKLFSTIGLLSNHGTTLATFSAAGAVKRALLASGFAVHKKKGYGRKREMITATWQKKAPVLPKEYQTPWYSDIAPTHSAKHALIIGAGLAGCFTAYALSRRGWTVSLIEAKGASGAGASGNRQAVLYPRLSAFSSPYTDFMLHAFLFAARTYQSLQHACTLGELNGILQLAHNQKEKAAQAHLKAFLKQYPQLGVLVDKQAASQLAGIAVLTDGLFVPMAGWMDSLALCRYLLSVSNIHEIIHADIEEIEYDNGYWYAGSNHANALVLANGLGSNQLAQTCHLPLKPIRGQLSAISATKESARIKIPLCAQGHVLPSREGSHVTGATYHLGVTSCEADGWDDDENLRKLHQLPLVTKWSDNITSQWCHVRMATPDYLPLVGPVPKEQDFIERFAPLAANARRWIPSPGAYYPGLYICSGFGSRGLTSIPLSAEILAKRMNGEPIPFATNLIKSLAPARFLMRSIISGRVNV